MCQGCGWKAPILLLAVVVSIGLSTAAVSPLHWHSAELGKVCDVCLVGHLPVLQTLVSLDLRPPAPLDWHISAADFFPEVAPLGLASPSRAPPA